MSAILVLCLSIAGFLPLAAFRTASTVEARLYGRGKATPLLAGAKGSPFLLTLNTLYFRTRIKEKLPVGARDRIRAFFKGKVIPLHTFHSVRGVPVVGTTFAYFRFRGLTPVKGVLPEMLGDAVLGSRAAERLHAKPGDGLISDTETVYDISAEYPLKMHVTGVLAPTGSPDDDVIFTDLKTAWIMDGIGHGHANPVATTEQARRLEKKKGKKNPDDAVLFLEAGEVVYNSRLKKYNEVTPENIQSFHFHGDPASFPVSALILVPEDYEEEVLALSRINLSDDMQAVRPTAVVEEILGILLDVKRVFDGFSLLLLISTAAFMVLVLSLQVRQRRGEMLILYRIGGGRHAVEAMLAMEVGILLAVSALLAVLFSAGVEALVRMYWA